MSDIHTMRDFFQALFKPPKRKPVEKKPDCFDCKYSSVKDDSSHLVKCLKCDDNLSNFVRKDNEN